MGRRAAMYTDPLDVFDAMATGVPILLDEVQTARAAIAELATLAEAMKPIACADRWPVPDDADRSQSVLWMRREGMFWLVKDGHVNVENFDRKDWDGKPPTHWLPLSVFGDPSKEAS